MTETKVCIVCGEDCSDRPRLRNSTGRYACRACIDAKRQARERFRAERARRIAEHDPEEQVSPIFANLNDTTGWMAADTIEAATHGRHGPHCPVCGKVTRGDGLICVECRERARAEEAGHETPAMGLAPEETVRVGDRTNPVDLLYALQAVSPPSQPSMPPPASFDLAPVLQGCIGSALGIVAVWGGAIAFGIADPGWLLPLAGFGAGAGIALAVGPHRGTMHAAAAVATLAVSVALGQVVGDEVRTAREAGAVEAENDQGAETDLPPEDAIEPSVTAPVPGSWPELGPLDLTFALAGIAAAWGIGRGNSR